MLVDVNLLVYATVEAPPFHARSRDWFNTAFNGANRPALMNSLP